jgi:hypothetical protein
LRGEKTKTGSHSDSTAKTALAAVLQKEKLDHSKWVARVHSGWELAEQFLRERGFDTRELDDLPNPYESDEFYASNLLFTTPAWVEAPKELIIERAVIVERVKTLSNHLENLLADGVMPYGPETDLIRSWPKEVIVQAYMIGRALSHKPTLRRLAGYSVKDGPRDSTAERRKNVAAFWQMRYQQVRTARKRYTANKKDNWREIVKNADPQLPEWLIDELPRESKQEPKLLTARWLAEDLRSTPSAILEDVKALKKSGEL